MRLAFSQRFLISILCLAFAHGASAQSLSDIEAKSRNAGQDIERAAAEVNGGLEKLVESDQLQTAEEFRRAGEAVLIPYDHRLEASTLKYQLLLSALALGDSEAAKQMGAAWDSFLIATGRYRRIGAMNLPGKVEKGDEQWVDPAPEPIRRIYLDPEQARKSATLSKNNAEVQKIVDDDQNARKVDWTKLTAAQMRKIGEDDRARFRRIKEIVAVGGLKTPSDYENAALVCQHGQVFMDYALSHELCVCAMVLGKTTFAKWLSGASYDRMLLSAGYPQRFDTQYSGANWAMQKFTTQGVNDRMRKAIVGLTLVQSQARQKG